MLRLLTTTAIVAAGLLAAPPVFAQTGEPSHPAVSSAKDALDQEDRKFVQVATIGGMAEVELSKIAQKSENADVKRFADRMIEDHTKANEQMTATTRALGVEPPKAVDSAHERMRDDRAPASPTAYTNAGGSRARATNSRTPTSSSTSSPCRPS